MNVLSSVAKQTYLQLKTARLAEMRVKEQERDYCMAFYTLPHDLKKRIKKDQWREDIALTMDKFFPSLPKDLRKDTKRYICLGALRRVSSSCCPCVTFCC